MQPAEALRFEHTDVRDKLIEASIGANPDMRKGSHSNFVSLQLNKSDCILDFCFLDVQNPDAGMEARLAFSSLES